MRHERQVEILERIEAAGPRRVGLFGPESMVNPASVYTDPVRFAAERRVLFREGPVFAGLSCEIPNPGDVLTATFDGLPIAVVRQADGSVAGLVNACRHRGSPLVTERVASCGARLACPYHAWTYELDGRLAARPMSDGAFDDVTLECNLHRVAVAEKYGMIFVRAGGPTPIDVDAVLGGAEDDLGSFDLGSWHHIETRVNTWDFNWKFVLDTFCESYHIRWLHKDSLAPTFLSDCTVVESFGRNFNSIGLRKSVVEEFTKPVEERSIIPHSTIQYFLVPNALLVHQLDHVELWRLEPVDVHTTIATTSIFAPQPATTEKAQRYWARNHDLLLQVTGTEDFPVMAAVQRSLEAGAISELVYGRVEPALTLFHRAVTEAVESGTTGL